MNSGLVGSPPTRESWLATLEKLLPRPKLDRAREAEPLLLEALANHEIAFGEDHFLTHFASASLALVLTRQGRLEEADQRLERALAAVKPVFGEEHHMVAEFLHYHGQLRQAQGRLDEAQAIFERALAIRERDFGAQGQPTLETRKALEGLRPPTR